MASLRFLYDEILTLDVPGCSDEAECFAEIHLRLRLPAPLKALDSHVSSFLVPGRPESAYTVAEKQALLRYGRTMGKVLKLWKVVDRYLRSTSVEESGVARGAEGLI